MTDAGLPPDWSAPIPESRLAPLGRAERTPEVDEMLSTMPAGPDGEVLNLFATLAHHPRLLKRWAAFGGVLLARGTLSDRARELLILRTAWNCRAHYEWVHHGAIGRAAGLSREEIARVAEPGTAGWDEDDAALLRAADELHEGSRIAGPTWDDLAKRYDEAQLIELCMVVGQYHLVAFTLNSLGVQLEE